MKYKRKQILIEKWQDNLLWKISKRLHCSQAEAIRFIMCAAVIYWVSEGGLPTKALFKKSKELFYKQAKEIGEST